MPTRFAALRSWSGLAQGLQVGNSGFIFLATLLRLAHEWKEIQSIPRIRLLRGEHARESIMTPTQEKVYFAACPSPLGDVALLLLDTGLRLCEALSLEWAQVKLEPAQGAKFGYLTVSSGKAKSKKSGTYHLVKQVSPWPNSHLGQQHARMRTLLKMPADFVLHSLRHTFGTRLGESRADAFTIMRLMGHSTVTVSQR
jgi:integrase